MPGAIKAMQYVNAVKVMTQVVVLTSLSLGDLLLGCKEYKETDQPVALGIEQLLPPGGRRCNCCFKKTSRRAALTSAFVSVACDYTQGKKKERKKDF